MKSLLALLLVAGSAHAENVWQHAVEASSPNEDREGYNRAVADGDEQVMQALNDGQSKANQRQRVESALASYDRAAAMMPKEPEVYYKIGRTLYSFYFEACDNDFVARQKPSMLCPIAGFDTVHAKLIIEAWDKFEQLAPLDPRVSVERDDGALGVDFNLLFHRAILHTKFGDKKNLLAAIGDYERILHRTDKPGDTVLSNLAETYMMLGRLDDAIEMYRRALMGQANVETAYGLAVALDRDERGDQALDLILAQGQAAMASFHDRVERGVTFFVPRGEEFYYYALGYEAFDLTDKAIASWQDYKKSDAAKAHPEYAARVKAHLDALLSHRSKAPVIDTPWRDFLR
ncbi:MAG: hypothetical protein QM831_08515 [Kofleriaceae bacterium]